MVEQLFQLLTSSTISLDPIGEFFRKIVFNLSIAMLERGGHAEP